MSKTFRQYQKIHLDTDNRDFGRVVGDGTILEVLPRGGFLVEVKPIRANIVVPAEDMYPLPEEVVELDKELIAIIGGI